METTSFRHLLESFCSDSPWNYAVFWKLQQFQDQMRLIYEDGFYDFNVLQQRSQNILSQFAGEEDILNLRFVPDLLVEDVPEFPISFTSDGISCHQYLLGQGMIGRAALSGNDLWLYSDDTESMELNSYLELHRDEWLLPVSPGIKTTFTTPILPYGVLQLGSFEKVAENFANVADIKERIFSLMCTTIYKPSHFGEMSNFDETSHSWSSILVPEWENKEDSSVNLFESSHFQSAEEFYAAEFADIISTGYEIVDPCHMEDISTSFLLTSDMDISHQFLDLGIELGTLNDFTIPDMPEAFENIWTFCCLEEEHVDTGISSDSSTGVSSYIFLEQEQPSPETENDGASNNKLLANFEGSPGQTNPQDAIKKSFSFGDNADSREDLNLSAISCCGWFDEGGDHDYLLEAAVASLYENTDDTLTSMFNCSRSTVTSLAELAPSFQVQTSVEANATLPKNHTNVSQGQSTSLSLHQSTTLNTLVSTDSYESFGSAGFKDEKPTGCEYEFSCNNAKMSKHKKVRDGPKINLRPRPRDRQLIQDRLKQLRKLVPIGTKSSIDGLLEQTTKHMMFLRSVVEQAKKVKHFTDQKDPRQIYNHRFNINKLKRSRDGMMIMDKGFLVASG
ncbi:hypothetical protein RND81_13G082200 [Saponaria officinalis]|uniref:BHLH domain-containing protein n=1 Tax=Saponaria officinalis TaxID=3572 RepID=A0AAW1GY71_SAPOF